ncbi:MAG: carotenoid oxygenase family protein [Myxococcota bacterium]
MSENLFLEGNFAPVAEEVTAFDLEVKGEIPKQLEGRLLRIGPNPIAPVPESHHWFLGNGMVHGLRLRDGKALWYRNRYVVDDEVAEAKGLPSIETPSREDALGEGVVNTNVIQHAGQTLAIVEAGSLPIELDYELETIRRSDFGGTLIKGLSAHPIVDPDTGELHTAVYSPMSQTIQYVVVGKDGRVRKAIDVPVPGSPMVHSCMITKNYFIFLDLPVILDPAVIEAGYSLPYKWHPEYGARVGLLPRTGKAEDVTWHEVDPCYVFHPMNGYEDEGGRVVLDVIRHSEMFASDMNGPTDGKSTLDRWLIDPTGGPVQSDRLDDANQEFPRIDERRTGKAYRYGYTAGLGDDMTLGGLKKHDLKQGTSELHNEGDDRIFMEPVFVPESPNAGEDEGWIMAYVYDRARDASDVVIFHAQDFEAPPVATIRLPQRVPFGFHGNWVADEGSL